MDQKICIKLEYLCVVAAVYILHLVAKIPLINRIICYFIRQYLLGIINAMRTALIIMRPVIIRIYPEQDRKAVVIDPSAFSTKKRIRIKVKKRVRRHAN
jgi:hypothetical protein